MSQRQYVIVNEQKVYDWSQSQTEYSCDTCGKIIEAGVPQIHLWLDGRKFQSGKGTDDIPKLTLDLHMTPDCIKNCGVLIYQNVFAPEFSPENIQRYDLVAQQILRELKPGESMSWIDALRAARHKAADEAVRQIEQRLKQTLGE